MILVGCFHPLQPIGIITKSKGSDSMASEGLERKRTAILSADAAGYSRLMLREEARAAAEEPLRVEPGFCLVGWERKPCRHRNRPASAFSRRPPQDRVEGVDGEVSELRL